jgi:hypothetical protein
MTESMPDVKLLWDYLTEVIERPKEGEPQRPLEVQVDDKEIWQELKPHLDEIGVRLTPLPELDMLDEMFQELAERMGDDGNPALVDVPGITSETVGRYYEAAAAFFEAAPWKVVGYSSAIRIQCDQFQGGPWYGMVMGQSGLSIGLALYEDLQFLTRLLNGEFSEEEAVRLTVATSANFGDETTVAFADIEAARLHGWKVARPDAYPSVFHKARGPKLRQPEIWQVELLDACLRAIPEFMHRRMQNDSTEETVTVSAATGSRTLKLAWMP